MKIAVIGTAGRKKELMYPELWPKMKSHFYDLFCTLQWLDHKELVSGGAAWADHLALYGSSLYQIPLTLHLPVGFDKETCQFVASKTGATANYYHRLFSKMCGINSLFGINQALETCTSTVSRGFQERNLLVGQAEYLIAYTFGTKNSFSDKYNTAEEAGLADGGTAHTWNNSQARYRLHVNLYDL